MIKADKKRLEKKFKTLLKFNSPSGQEKDVADYCLKELRRLGLEASIDKFYNVIAKKSGKNEPVLLSAHTDTVESTEGQKLIFKNNIFRTDKKTILGSDDKAGVAVIFEVLEVLREKNNKDYSLEVVLTSGEENGLVGASKLRIDNIKSKLGLVLDYGKNVGRVVKSAPNASWIMIEVLGRAAHSGSEPEKGINSISAAAKMINGIKLGQVDSKTTANIGVISGGTKANIVPAKTTFTLELRGHDLYRFNSLKNKYLNHFKNIAKEYKTKIIIRERKILNGYSFLEEDQALVFFKKACAKTGVKYSPSLAMGGSDANIFNKGRMDILDISVGIWNAHSGQEYIKLSDMEKSVKLILNYLDIVNKV